VVWWAEWRGQPFNCCLFGGTSELQAWHLSPVSLPLGDHAYTGRTPCLAQWCCYPIHSTQHRLIIGMSLDNVICLWLVVKSSVSAWDSQPMYSTSSNQLYGLTVTITNPLLDGVSVTQTTTDNTLRY